MSIAIVDGYSTGAALAARLHHLGVPCSHIQSQPDNHDFLRRTFDLKHYTRDHGFVPDTADLADLLSRGGTTRVVAGTESGVTLAETLSHTLGLPTNSPQQRAARRDKNLMAAAVSAAGLATPRTHLAASAVAAARWFSASGLPEAVVKPVDSAGSDGVRFCRTSADVRDATNTVLHSRSIFGRQNTAALVQERLIGTEFYINTVSLDGRHKVAETWRYTKQARPGGGPIYDYEEPIPADTAEARLLRDFTFAVLDALGIRNSPAHTEVMLTRHEPRPHRDGRAARRCNGTGRRRTPLRHVPDRPGRRRTGHPAGLRRLRRPPPHLARDPAQRRIHQPPPGRADRTAMTRAAALPSAVAVCPAVDHGTDPADHRPSEHPRVPVPRRGIDGAGEPLLRPAPAVGTAGLHTGDMAVPAAPGHEPPQPGVGAPTACRAPPGHLPAGGGLGFRPTPHVAGHLRRPWPHERDSPPRPHPRPLCRGTGGRRGEVGLRRARGPGHHRTRRRTGPGRRPAHGRPQRQRRGGGPPGDGC